MSERVKAVPGPVCPSSVHFNQRGFTQCLSIKLQEISLANLTHEHDSQIKEQATYCMCITSLVKVQIVSRDIRNHVSSICSTWGREHFKTFDGDVYQFPGMCEYNLASDCHESYQEFSVHMKRKENDGNPTVSYVVVTINDHLFHLTKSQVTVNSLPIKMPYYNAGVQVERNAVYIKLQSKVGLIVTWNGDDAVMVELDPDYANRTCGLCGDFNGVSVYNEFIHNGRKMSPIEFGNNQKVHRPNDNCEDPFEEEDESLEAVTVPDSCKEFQTTCERMLRSESWSSCTKLINPEPYIQACVQDMCGCNNRTNDFCVCSTLSELSRQCSHAGGQPPNWRTPQFCAKQCPFNMVYEESGSPCIDTCTHLDTSSLCEGHKMDGCFCPPGTVFDDISLRGCIAQSECQCKHDKIYNPGEVYRQDREECTCFEGRWACESLQTPATCAVEEGSHVTTFDGKTYTFHGDCFYTLAKTNSSPKFTILVQLVPCRHLESDTCLKTLKILLNNDKNNVLTFTSDGTVKQNMQTITLPHHSGDINIFHASSFHILLQTSFGLQIQIQHVPVMQVYVSLEQSYRAKTRGLCGNYNMVLSDDMKTPQGIVEGTAATFSNSWKANFMCRDREERLDDPCAFSVENENYAKHWCTLLLSPNSTFAQCHSVTDPEMYYKRCTYASCNCEKSEACLCAVFSSYARACASKGVFLTDWRQNVCDKYTRSCPASQTFSYKNQRCQLTCRSLGAKQKSCTSDFLPVDGCSCSEGLYLNENGLCVPMAKCSCYHNEVYIQAGKSISMKDEHWTPQSVNLAVSVQVALLMMAKAPRMEVKLSKGHYKEEDLGDGPQIQYKIRRVGLYLVIESAIGLTVMWDRKTTVRVLLEPRHSGEVCGLCGDFDGDGQNDFTTQAVFCDYYNSPGECKWHYNPCHTPCYKTCLNPQGICSNPLPHLEVPTTTTKGPTEPPSTTPTTECFCIVNGKHYSPGDVIFDMEHIGSGVCLTMTCSAICEIHNKTEICTTTAMPSTTPSTTPSVPTCPEWDVGQNDTFYLCNCTMARCIENNTIEIIPYECPPIENITCANGKKPVLVYDEYFCCRHYACDCVCEGWGDPHYNTFDGLYYSYQGNCTYVLMEEIFPKHNLKIYIDNVFCDPTEDVSCPRSIIISYNGHVFTLINHNLVGAARLEALKDGASLKLPYLPTQTGVKILNSGINLILEIPRLNVVITFGITGFSVNLPFKNFGKNTQGHCGTCNNNQADDCMLPGGQLVESCAVMADYWLTKDISQPNCQIPSVLPTSKPEPLPTPCKPDSMCDLLKSSVFAECHPFVSPDNFHRGCVFDSCHVSNPVVECTSLQTYAAACAQAGVCIHWRNHTKLCAIACPSNKVYKPCGPAEQPTCEDNPNELTMNFTTEGCFCPEGMKLFNKESGLCVNKCGCLDPEGIPREFNERFEYKCQNCICNESSKTVSCKPKVCPTPPLTNCTGPGFVLVKQPDPSDPCCSADVCQCHSSTCPVTSMNCPVGYTSVVSVPEGKCCQEHICEPKRVCVHKGSEYQPGTLVPAIECQKCLCTNEVDPSTHLFKITCEFQHCQENCEMGYEYVETDSDKCCGKCVQTQCVVSVNSTKQLLMPGQTWSPPENKCEYYTCVKSGETLTTISSHIVCPPFKESNCQPDTIQTAANGCCKICVEREKACKLESMKTQIMLRDCQSYQEVDMPYCEGSCNTFAKYSEKAAALHYSCSCCKETRFSNRTIDLHCLNGDVVPYTYIHVEECSCSPTDCNTAAGQPARRRRSSH
ncbi:mucin-2-like [Micropterus dolomieu]|uniref:mucin-2-like n=1 Tax=Micropterus dolomieu TaxID=147949 RepID=UPI001E8E66B4|nr:mucin-2-like [Micropterus dolomieu]